jgi:hypothetical protein
VCGSAFLRWSISYGRGNRWNTLPFLKTLYLTLFPL